ncbi:MAG: discoidin domain-containing protein, partial [Leptospirales bacterium]|nr:discoidin domain-containing protein [Leptospirales bacterium]
MKYATISARKILTGEIISVSSEYDSKTGAANLLAPAGLWRTGQRTDSTEEYVIIDYGENTLLNFIELVPSSIGSDTFPKNFRFEWSKDLDIWHILHSENAYEVEDKPYQVYLPVTELRYLKIVVFHDEKPIAEIASLNAGTSGVKGASASSSREGHGVLNLFDNGKTSWASSLSSAGSIEHVSIDLGNPYTINRLFLISSDDGFPENFHVSISLDDEIWTPLLDIKGFKAENNKKYSWDTNVAPARYIRFEARSVRLQSGEYGLQLQGIEIAAAPHENAHVHNIGSMTPYASVFQAGVVTFAKDGETSDGKAVQGSDWRLRDATTIFKGIAQLAADGDVDEGLAVQASDSRLKAATETHMGIVRLASDGEIQPGSAVQGNDSRIKTATTEHPGIVRICPDGLYSAQSVITGNDSRIHKATTEHFGIVRLAADGETQSGHVVQADDRRLRDGSEIDRGIIIFARDGVSQPLQAVQGSDKRLKDATTFSKGIVELAEDGENKPNTVVQGSDRRLKDATTSSKGIVELAEDGEDKPGVAVQGNDKRLKDATTSSKGIVELAEDGEDIPNTAVQGSDKR